MNGINLLILRLCNIVLNYYFIAFLPVVLAEYVLIPIVEMFHWSCNVVAIVGT